MGFFADIYVIQVSRSKKMGIAFLDHFLPLREESAVEYEIPQYSDEPIRTFHNAEEVMSFLELKPEYYQSIYWRNTDPTNPNEHGMIFYTEEGNMIFGISRSSAISGDLNTDNEDDCLNQMKAFFATDLVYIDYENPPVITMNEFVEMVNRPKEKELDKD